MINNTNLTDNELRTLHKVDATGHILPTDKDILIGLHFCPDWDGLAIFNKCIEWEACCCRKVLVDRKYTELLIGQRFKLHQKSSEWLIKQSHDLQFNIGDRHVTLYPHSIVIVQDIWRH